MSYLDNNAHRPAIERVLRSFSCRLDDPPSLSDMARIASMSPFHFNRVFRRITGLPPRRFLSAMRIRQAIERVVTTDSSITDICFDTGYDSLGTFITQFKKSVGASPTRLRSLSRSSSRKDAPKSTGLAVEEPGAQGSIRVRGCARHGGEPVSSAFMGIFSRPSPEGMPLACAISDDGGGYEIIVPEPGRFHLFAAKLSIQDPIVRFEGFLQLVGHVVLDLNTRVQGGEMVAEVAMHPPCATDPPLLSLAPVLSFQANAGVPPQLHHTVADGVFR